MATFKMVYMNALLTALDLTTTKIVSLSSLI
uniref:Uncharacterized protein n=1 Tax=Siphoviridae sp. cthHz3 TaxID=2825614 RepID=A0A8S5UYE8_9CAUD|nr:MAG TPA: hypothetical protein [Siphoviridae sp. cthHz3]DAL97598.1 MAG TPA: hypothetical protein [Caudoviricetes sp.]